METLVAHSTHSDSKGKNPKRVVWHPLRSVRPEPFDKLRASLSKGK